MRQKRLIVLAASLLLMLVFTGCQQAPGELQIVVLDSQHELVDDVYIGVYDEEFKKRKDFFYTSGGQVVVKGLEEGVYGIKVVGEDEIKETRVNISAREISQLKFEL